MPRKSSRCRTWTADSSAARRSRRENSSRSSPPRAHKWTEHMLRTILTILQVLSAFAIVGLVLLQRGKGADAGAGFGAGASGTVFGARGATTGLPRMTAVFAAIFMINSLCLTYLFQREARAVPASLLEKVPVT